MNDAVQGMRKKITEIGRLLFLRLLTDAAGGNISARVDDYICITPRFSGSKFQWQLRPEQVLVSDLQGKILEGEGEISREAKVHFRLYQDCPDGKAIVHAHPRNALVFASACQPIEPVLEATLKFGTIRAAPYAPAHSLELAEFLSECLKGQEARIRKQAAGALASWHGLFVVGKDLDSAFDAVERIDVNARCILLSRLLPGFEAADPGATRARLEEALQRFQ
jgi:L-fuculose-phosphate aldolase